MSRTLRLGMTALILAVALPALASCAPESEGAASGSATPASASPTGPTGSASASAEPSASGEAIAFPSECTQIYSDQMRARLEEENPPLNHGGITMDVSEVVGAMEVLQAVSADGQSLRCTWGPPSEIGLATTVSIVTPEQAATVESALVQDGVECAPYDAGTLCTVTRDHYDDRIGEWSNGEIHYLADGVWIATGWLNWNPEGYTDDIIATLWNS